MLGRGVQGFFNRLSSLDTEQEDTYKTIKSKLHKLFDDRNDIMHKGQNEGLTESHCQKLISSVRDLVSLELR